MEKRYLGDIEDAYTEMLKKVTAGVE